MGLPCCLAASGLHQLLGWAVAQQSTRLGLSFPVALTSGVCRPGIKTQPAAPSACQNYPVIDFYFFFLKNVSLGHLVGLVG